MPSRSVGEGKERSDAMSLPNIRERLLGCWRLVGYSEAVGGGEASHPLGDTPLGTILYTPDGYMSAQLARPGPYQDAQEPTAYAFAYSGPFDVDEQSSTVAHHVQVSVIPSWVGTTQTRKVQFPDPSTLILSAFARNTRGGVLTTSTITWSRQPPH
jgi:Lipocalin-like domain